MTKKTPWRILLAGALLVAVAAPALSGTAPAYAHEGWSLRFYAASIDFETSSSIDRPPPGRYYDLDIGAGLGISAEYRFSRRLGVEVGALAGAGVDVEAQYYWLGEVRGVVYDTVTFTPLMAGLDIHLRPDSRVDLYLCPLVALVRYGGLEVTTRDGWVTTGLDIDDDFAVGGAVGLGVPFGEGSWSFQANLTYLDSTLNGGDRDVRVDSDYDTTMFGVGFGYRF